MGPGVGGGVVARAALAATILGAALLGGFVVGALGAFAEDTTPDLDGE